MGDSARGEKGSEVRGKIVQGERREVRQEVCKKWEANDNFLGLIAV